MAILYEGDTARFLDVCTVDEALDLLEWLRGRSQPKIELEACTHLHTALFQVILATRPAINSLPEDAFLSRRLREAVRPHPPANSPPSRSSGEKP
ncbi:MAG: hypothetical protein WCF85_20830 [Rhodospirillaceae bacterium]